MTFEYSYFFPGFTIFDFSIAKSSLFDFLHCQTLHLSNQIPEHKQLHLQSPCSTTRLITCSSPQWEQITSRKRIHGRISWEHSLSAWAHAKRPAISVKSAPRPSDQPADLKLEPATGCDGRKEHTQMPPELVLQLIKFRH